MSAPADPRRAAYFRPRERNRGMGFRSGLVALAIVAGAAAWAQPASQAEAYRVDRLQTRALNDAERARLAMARGASRPIDIVPPPAAPTAAEIDLARRVGAAIAAWRDRRDACRAGRKAACD